MASSIHINPAHRGLLHHELGIPEGRKISLATLMRAKTRAKRTGNTALEKRAVFAENFGGHNK